ncbi:MAG: HAMP domain-containing sensor histidine kinase [Burkholderiaceae bacterium]
MKQLPSIRQRLSRTLISFSVASGIAVSAVVWLVVQHEVDELLDNTLQESAEILFGLLSFNRERLPLQSGGSLPAPTHDERLVWQIVGPSKNVLLRSHRAPDQALVGRETRGFDSIGGNWRVFTMAFDSSGSLLHVAQRGDARREARLQAAGLAASAALLVGLLCAVWLGSRVEKELRPLSTLSDAVARFDPMDVHSMLSDVTRAELVPMREAINELGARLAKRLANERAFSAHAAHALRTPLAGLMTQLAIAQRESPPEVQPRLERAREAANRLRRVVTALLTLFRTGADVKWQSVDVAALVAQLPFDGLSVVTERPMPMTADPDLLAAAFLNLFDNSLRHGASVVNVTSVAEEDRMHIVVSDDGHGIPQNQFERLQAALQAQDYEGKMGLGLMLADLVARAHGGKLSLISSARGCTVDMVLQARPPDRQEMAVEVQAPPLNRA